MSFFRSRFGAACVASVMTAIVVGGIGWAAQPDAVGRGLIHACYNPASGTIRIRTSAKCPLTGTSQALDWDAKGRRGAPGTPGTPGEPGAPGPATLDALKGTACTVGTAAGVVRVQTDPTTGTVSITCSTQVTVSATATGGTMTGLQISDFSTADGNDCNFATTCSYGGHVGDSVRVLLNSGDASQDLPGSEFTFTCPGSQPALAEAEPFSGGVAYRAVCQATVHDDYAVTASFGG